MCNTTTDYFCPLYIYIYIYSFHIVHPQLTANTERLINRTYLPWINPLEPYYGQTLTLTCPLEGNPQASYKWYFLNETLQQRNDSFIMIDEEYRESNGIFPQNSSDHRQLTIDKFLEQHNGHYFCSAENYLGSDNFLFPLFQVWSTYTIVIKML